MDDTQYTNFVNYPTSTIICIVWIVYSNLLHLKVCTYSSSSHTAAIKYIQFFP